MPMSALSTLIFFLEDNSFKALSSKSVAIISSTNCLLLISIAVFLSSFLLKAIIPPNAEVGSVLKARSYDSKTSVLSATPHGLACFTTVSYTHLTLPRHGNVLKNLIILPV